MRLIARLAAAAAATVLGLGAALAQSPAGGTDWPSRSVSVLVPLAAGGNTDIMARLAAEHLNKKFGQPFVVQNRPSAGGILTSQQLATSDPDGYTLLFAPISVVLLTPLVQAVQFDPEKLVPVTNVGTGVQVLGIKSSLPAKSFAEFIAYAKANPGKLNWASAGVQNVSHLAPILMFKRLGLDLVHVAGRGEPQVITDLMGGSIDFYFGNAGVLLGTDKEKIRLLAVGTASRLPAAPELPAIAETLPGFEFASWNGFFVPQGTPEAIIEKLRGGVIGLVTTPEMKQKMTQLGIIPGGQSKAEVAAQFKKDRKSWIAAVEAAGIKKP